jgi:hypothetical protein
MLFISYFNRIFYLFYFIYFIYLYIFFLHFDIDGDNYLRDLLLCLEITDGECDEIDKFFVLFVIVLL